MKSHCINGHEYTEATIEMRPDGKARCRVCRRNRENYRNALRRGEAVDKPRLMAWERILDLLEIDGGWLTVPGIAVRLKLEEDCVRQALYRIRPMGVIEERVVEMALATRGELVGRPESRREFRFKSLHFRSLPYGESHDIA